MAFGQVGLADAGIGRLAQQRRHKGVPTSHPTQHATRQQLFDGAVEFGVFGRGRARWSAGAAFAQCLQSPRRYGVADDRRVAQNRARVVRQSIDARGEDGGQVARQQPTAERTGGQAPAAGGRVAADSRQRAAFHQKRDEFGQVKRVPLGGRE